LLIKQQFFKQIRLPDALSQSPDEALAISGKSEVNDGKKSLCAAFG
jgi:hypothetical protein